MALPSSGPLSINDIRTILGTSNGSLRYLSSLAGKSTPDAISEFYGYSPVVNYNVYWTFYPGIDYNYFQIFNYTKGTEAASLDYYGPGYMGSSFQASPGDLIGVYLYADGFYNYSVGTSCTVYEYPSYNTLLNYSTTGYPTASGFGQFYMPANEVGIYMSTYATS
jgi:hypothetical protein